MAVWALVNIHVEELILIDLSEQTIAIFGGPPALATGIAARFTSAAEVILRGNLSVDQSAITADINRLEHLHTVIILPQWHHIDWFMETSEADWDDALAQNYERAVYLAQAAVHHMIARQVAGSIIFGSTVAIHMPLMQTSAYATSLALLHPLTKMIAVDCGHHGIRANTLAMGWVETEWTAPHLQTATDRQYIEAGIPAGHIASPAAIGDVCAFLASPLARYITGGVIPVDGGYSLTRSDGNSPYP